MKDFILGYIGNRKVSFMMILDNAFYHRYGRTDIHQDRHRGTLSLEITQIINDCVEDRLVGIDEYNFFYRKDLWNV